MGKTKPLPFKKGMPVVWLDYSYGQIRLTEAVVSMVTTKDGDPVVYARHQDNWGGFYSRAFSPVAGMFQEKPYPIWKLIPLDGKNMKNLRKRAEHANKLFREYDETCQKIRSEVDYEGRDWIRKEQERRTAEVPHGRGFMQNVISRMGFKRPKEGVKVKVKGEVSIVK